MAGTRTKNTGKRALRTKERNDAIIKAAMALARRRRWPSPPAIAQKTGISASVVERETALLLDARREWERVTGTKHPQWRDPGAADKIAVDAGAPAVTEVAVTEADTASKADDKAGRDRKTIASQRQTIANLKEKVEELEEQVRRLLIGVRPEELGAILDAGAPKRRKGKAKKRVAVGP